VTTAANRSRCDGGSWQREARRSHGRARPVPLIATKVHWQAVAGVAAAEGGGRLTAVDIQGVNDVHPGNFSRTAAWIYEAPYAAVTEIKDRDAFYLVRADWIEEQHARPCAEVEAPIGHSADRAIDPVLILGTPLAAAPYRASGFVQWTRCGHWDRLRRRSDIL
jgi:hypothetical protein